MPFVVERSEQASPSRAVGVVDEPLTRQNAVSAPLPSTRSSAGLSSAGLPSVQTRVRPRSLYRSVGKRLVDFWLSSALVVLLGPVMAVIWLMLTATLGRGVILRQERVGQHGMTYECLKFRTMHHCRRRHVRTHAGPDRRRTHKSAEDPRHTRMGRVLRRYSIDELPQLFNVVGGTMSLVGPRPELAVQADDEFRRHVRHSIPPGLTGPFQLSSHRSSGDLGRGLGLDTEYVESLSFRNDLRYLFETLDAVRRGTGG